MNFINEKITDWKSLNPWTNVYGITRSILALSTFLTLLFNKTEYLFKPAAGIDSYPFRILDFTLFGFGQDDYLMLTILKYFALLILFLVIIGWRPRITGILHWYIALSVQNDIIVIDGGSQVSAILTFLLIPITLTDNRKWHWSEPERNNNTHSKIIVFITYFFIRLQIAILYFDSVVEKLKVQEWVDGTAVYYFTKDPIMGFNSVFTMLSNWIVESPFVVLITWLTLLVQMVLVFTLVLPKKYWKIILIVAVLMHEIFALFLGLITFSLTMLGALIIYLVPITDHISLKNIKLYKRGNLNEQVN